MTIIKSLFILIVFYSIYFVKMFIQKGEGIKTNQIGTCKEKELYVNEILLKYFTISIVIVEIVSIFLRLSYLSNFFLWLESLIGLTGDLIFLIAIIPIHNNWRVEIPLSDKTNLVTKGIYRFPRNPAFLSFDLMYIGILLLNFNLLNLVFTVFTILILRLQILQEEKYLEKTFKEEYLKYRRITNRYLGRRRYNG